MFDKFHKREYKALTSDPEELVPAILGYNRPGAAVGIFTQEGIVYRDFKGTEITIPKDKIQAFFKELRNQLLPTQAAFAHLFKSDKDRLENHALFEENLKQLGLVTKIDYHMLLLAEQTYKVTQFKYLSEVNKKFVKVHAQLLAVLNEFERNIADIASSRQSRQRQQEAISEYRTKMGEILSEVYAQYHNEVDGYNLVLNVVCMLTVLGLIGLLCKNVWRSGFDYEEWQLFQIVDVHSPQIAVLSELGSMGLFNNADSAANYFTKDIKDTQLSIEELKQFIQKGLRENLNESKLHKIYQKLSGPLQVFESVIKKLAAQKQPIASEVKQFENSKIMAEQTFMQAWLKALEKVEDLKFKEKDRFNISCDVERLMLREIRDQFAIELKTLKNDLNPDSDSESEFFDAQSGNSSPQS